MVVSEFKNAVWSPWFSTLSSSSFAYLSQIDLANSPPFTAQWSLLKHFVERKYLAVILSEEVSYEIYSFSKEYKKRFAQHGAKKTPFGIPIACFIVTFPTLT